MKRFLISAAALMTLSGMVQAQPEYRRIEMQLDIDKPAAEVWAAVGDYCAISEWLSVDCTIASGDGGVGTVRSLAGGRVIEILTAKSEFGYGYTQPVREGQFYNLYHGFMEARPMGANRTRMYYTLMLDVSNMADQAAKDADLARRRTQFEGALQNMKKLAESR